MALVRFVKAETHPMKLLVAVVVGLEDDLLIGIGLPKPPGDPHLPNVYHARN